jgi:hypothetical protein
MNPVPSAVALATIAVLAIATSAATASRLSLTSQTFTETFTRVAFEGGFGTTECALTLEGSLHSRTIARAAGSLVGYITRATLGACPRGSATILTASLPWHVRYASFNGTLPNITSINTSIVGMQFQIREPVFSVTCLAVGGVTQGGQNVAAGAFTTAVLSGRSPTNCGIEGTLSGTSTSLTVLGAATRISVALI